MRHVLLVDDDVAVLDALSKALRFQRDWAVEVASGGGAALGALERGGFDVVVTDARMPGVDGVALLGALTARWPTTLRVVLSGEVAATSAEQLLGLAQLLIAKPVKAKVLYRLVEEALLARERVADPELQALVGQLGSLPSVPRIFVELDALLSSADYELEEVAALVQRDPGVSANLLKAVNSAWFGLASPVLSLREAVRHLGGNPLRALVLAGGVFHGQGAIAGRLMSEAMARLATVTALGRGKAWAPWLEAASSAAVICDVARLFLAERRPDQWGRCEMRLAQGVPLLEAERTCFGADHPQLGAAMLGQWGLPREVVDAVARHHQPAQQADAAAAVALASLTLEAEPPADALDAAGAPFGLSVEAVRALGRPSP